MRDRLLSLWRYRRLHPLLGYVGLLVVFAWGLSQFYIPGKGFTYLIGFGSRQESQRISKVRQLDYYVERYSDGYDAQYYVQIAMDPSLQNKQLKHAVDSLPYRGRRILMSAVAYALGWGDPGRIVQAYALINAACWFALAAVLLHWFPPTNWWNFFRWAGVLFSFGVCVSVRNALIDGPSLLLIAFALYLGDKGRGWSSTAVLALSGLGKETNLLGAASLLPARFRAGREWMRAIVRGLLVALPLGLWLWYLSAKVGPALDSGARNFDWPLIGYGRKWQEVLHELPAMSWPNFGPLWSLLMMVSLSVQFAFMVLRPKWEQAWWRVGISFALLMIFLGDAVWEGYPGASSRVLLPMQLAFNVLVPAGRGWAVVLVLGNLTLLSAPAALQAPFGNGYTLKGESNVLYTAAGRAVDVEFGEQWYGVERGGDGYWCWASGDAIITVDNPHPYPLRAQMRFTLTTLAAREIELLIGDTHVWSTEVSSDGQVTAVLPKVTLAPGLNRLEFRTTAPGVHIGGDPRTLAFCLHNLFIRVERATPGPAGAAP